MRVKASSPKIELPSADAHWTIRNPEANCLAKHVTQDNLRHLRVNITARESQIERIDALAEAAGMTRSGYMVRASLGGGEGKRAVRGKSRGARAG